MLSVVLLVLVLRETDFDPHKHRRIEKATSYSETMMHMLKGSIGAGILAMPDGFRRMGVVYGSCGLFAIGIFATFCIHMLVTSGLGGKKIFTDHWLPNPGYLDGTREFSYGIYFTITGQYEMCKRAKKGYMTYPASLRGAINMGPPAIRWSAHTLAYFVDSVLIVWQLGLCCVYAVFMAENVKQVFDFYGIVINIRLHISILLIPLVIINMVKSLKLLSPISSISNVITVFGLLLVFFYLIEDDLDFDNEKFKIKSLIDVPVFIGTTLFALEAVGVILALEYNMENPKRFTTMFGLLNIGMAIILILYALVGVFGYLKYGDDVKASLTLNLPQTQKKAQAAKLIFAMAIFLTFPLQNFVAYNVIWQLMKQNFTGAKEVLVDYTLRIMLVIIPVAVAILVPTLGAVISLVGALCLSLLAIIFPAMIDICLWYPDQYGTLNYKLYRDFIIIVLGLFSLCAGVYTSILEMAE